MNATGALFSDQRLEEVLTRIHLSAPRQLIREVVDEVKAFSAGVPQWDDITALALQYVGAPATMGEALEIKLKNSLSELNRMSQSLSEFSVKHSLSARVLHDLNLAMEEIVTNIISYAYTDEGEHEIRVRLRALPGEVIADGGRRASLRPVEGTRT